MAREREERYNPILTGHENKRQEYDSACQRCASHDEKGEEDTKRESKHSAVNDAFIEDGVSLLALLLRSFHHLDPGDCNVEHGDAPGSETN